MSDEHTTLRLIIIFSVLCLLLSILFGILARISFLTLFFRSILFALLGSLSAFAISKVWNMVIGDTLSSAAPAHKDEEDDDEFFGHTAQDDGDLGADSDSITDTTSSMESPNALYQAQSYKDDANDYATEGLDIEDTNHKRDIFSSQNSSDNNMEDTSRASESITQENQELGLADPKISSNVAHEDITESNENREEFDNVSDENNNVAEDDAFQEDNFQDYKTNPALKPASQDSATSISSHTFSKPSTQRTMNNEYSTSFNNLEDHRYGIKTTGHAKYDAAIKKTVDVYSKTPEKVTKAVATWLQNGNNSK